MTANTERIAIAKDYLAMTKPRITWLILVTTAVGYFFGVSPGCGIGRQFCAWRTH